MKNNRHALRKCALQAIVSLEFEQEPIQAAHFAYLYDKEEEQNDVDIPLFLLNLVTGVSSYRQNLDAEIANKLKIRTDILIFSSSSSSEEEKLIKVR